MKNLVESWWKFLREENIEAKESISSVIETGERKWLYHPDVNDEGERVDVFTLPEEAIRQQREKAQTMGVDYDSDSEALDDFIATHWATWVARDGNDAGS